MPYIKVCKKCGAENEANLEYCKNCEAHIIDRKYFEFKEKNLSKEYRQCQICRT